MEHSPMTSPLDLNELRKIVAIKHNVLLSPDDPILVTLTLNELVLGRYLELVNQHSEDAERRLASAIAEQLAAARASAGAIITDAADYVETQVRQSVHAAVLEADRQVQQHLADAQTASREIAQAGEATKSAKTIAVLSAVSAGFCAIIAITAAIMVMLG